MRHTLHRAVALAVSNPKILNQLVDLVVVGEGILGRSTALLASRSLAKHRRMRIVVVADRGDSRRIPHADTHRNHSWQQSGLLYGGDAVLAAQMLSSGRNLHRAVGVEPPTQQGIFRIQKHDSAKITEAASKLGLRSLVGHVTPAAAQRRLGKFFVEGYAHFSVPDAPFDEPRVMDELQRQAEQEGVSWMYGRASLQRVGREAVVVVTDPSGQQTKLQAPCVVLCTGAGTIKLLDSIEVPHELVVYQSGLIRIYSDKLMDACLLADRTKNLSVVRFPVDRWNQTGCTVIGGGEKRLVSASTLGDAESQRRLSKSEINNLWALMSPDFRDRYERNAKYTVGYKTEQSVQASTTESGVTPKRGQARIRTTVDSAVSPAPGFDNLVYAIPGKATLAWHCANSQILPEIRTRTKGGQLAATSNWASLKSHHPQQEILFHYQDAFKDQSEE
jgi:glycine/D-amino acid oxidase-like deaminating enzyme